MSEGTTDGSIAPRAVEAMPFGEALERLEAIVNQLEANEALGLEEALALYEQGLALAGDCRRRLAAAQLKLTELAVPAAVEPEPESAQ
jgi:exodeoxyribonuclease VII small subunit